MKQFATILEEVIPSRSDGDWRFRAKHTAEVIDDPNAEEDSFTSDAERATNRADYKDGEDELVYERTITEAFRAGRLKLDDGSVVQLKAPQADKLNQLFSDLNSINRRRMLRVLMLDQAGFTEIMGFAEEAD